MSIAPAFEIKSASIDLLAFVLKSSELSVIEQMLQQKFKKRSGDADELFILDLNALDSPDQIDIKKLCVLTDQYGIRFIALRHRDPQFLALAKKHHWHYQAQESQHRAQPVAAEKKAIAVPEKKVVIPPQTVSPAPVQPKPSTGIAPPMVVTRPVRAGQQIYAKNSDLILLAMVSAGAEVIADGNIHIYAPLRGRALAGAKGNKQARIFVQNMQAELVSIAGVYRTMEQALPGSLNNQAVQVYLEDNRLVITALTQG